MIRTGLILLTLIALALFAGPARAEESPPEREVKLDWMPVPEAVGYDLELKPIGANKPAAKTLRRRVKRAQWRGRAPVGRYEMRMRSIDDRGVPGDWSAPVPLVVALPAVRPELPAHKSRLQSRKDDVDSVDFRWQPATGASSYVIEVRSEDGKTSLQRTISENTFRAELPVGQAFQWRVHAVDATGAPGDSSSQARFFVHLGKSLDSPKIETPSTKYVQRLTWSPVKNADSYSFLLLRRNPSGAWRLIEKSDKISATQFDFQPTYAGGDYRLMVRAHGRLRPVSEYSRMEFAVHSGDRSPAAVAQAILRESIDKPGSWYAVASYLLTQFSYVSRSPERNTVSEFKTLGGTGRLGVGFKPPEKPWGGFAIVDMGGFTLDGRNYTFASTEAHATYNFPLQVSVAQASAGLYTKTLPSLTVASVQNPSNLELSSVASRGMHFGGRFWHPFSTHWGAAAHAQLYLPVAGSTPNGQPIESMPSFEIGLKGTFRLSAHSIGFAGYTFREDTARYRALDDRFDANQINLSGHYLNFILEYAFD